MKIGTLSRIMLFQAETFGAFQKNIFAIQWGKFRSQFKEYHRKYHSKKLTSSDFYYAFVQFYSILESRDT